MMTPPLPGATAPNGREVEGGQATWQKIAADDLAATGSATPVGPRRVNPDDGRFIRLVVAGVVIAGLVAFAISFTALYEVAEWLGIPPFMWWAVPVFIDLAILVYAGSVLVHKARGEQTWPSWAALGTFTALSVFANGAHSLSSPQEDPWQGVVGAIIAGMVPVAIFVATEQLSRVAVEDPASRRAELREQAQMEQARAEYEKLRLNMKLDRERQDRQMAHERDAAERAAELEKERHQGELARLRAHRELESPEPFRPTPSKSERVGKRPAKHIGEDETAPEDCTAEELRTGLRVVTTSSVSPGEAVGALDEVAEFVALETTQGHEISAAVLAERFGMSERTGRRRLKALREARPEVFLQLHDEDEWKEQG